MSDQFCPHLERKPEIVRTTVPEANSGTYLNCFLCGPLVVDSAAYSSHRAVSFLKCALGLKRGLSMPFPACPFPATPLVSRTLMVCCQWRWSHPRLVLALLCAPESARSTLGGQLCHELPAVRAPGRTIQELAVLRAPHPERGLYPLRGEGTLDLCSRRALTGACCSPLLTCPSSSFQTVA